MESNIRENDGDESAQDNGDGRKARSQTTYPYYGLQEAIRFGEAVQRAGGNEASEDDIRSQLGLTSKTSRGWSYRLSNAREFGLIERSGRASEARIRVTPLFKRYSMPENEAEKRAALMQALVKPPLYVRLMERYRGAPVPDAQGIANVLEREYGLLPAVKSEAAEAFLAFFRTAGVITGANTVATVAAGGETPMSPPLPPEPRTEALRQPPASDEQTIQVPASFIAHVFQLRRDLQIMVPLPPDLTAKDVARLYKWLVTLPIDEEGGQPSSLAVNGA
ncbi:MAG: hypothetical protein IPI67_13075 [Myxococcales bacterium]|nr:hypothetical protein [Myxococcales bacterium]